MSVQGVLHKSFWVLALAHLVLLTIEAGSSNKKSILKKESITFSVLESATSKNKIMRKGILVTRKDAAANVLICHGYMCNKRDIDFLRYLLFPKYNVLTFDFRAHGELTQGQCCSFGYNEKYDVKGAVDFIKAHPELKDKPLLVYGFSMGAVSAIEAQAHEGNLFDGMILDCPFDTTDNLINHAIEQMKLSIFGFEFGMPGRSLLRRYAYHPYVQSMIKFALKTIAKIDVTQVNTCMHKVTPVESIKRVTVPCFIIGCKNDEKVPEEAVRSIYANAAGTKWLWITDGFCHFGSLFFNPEGYAEMVQRFAHKVITKSFKESKRQKIIQDPPLQHYELGCSAEV